MSQIEMNIKIQLRQLILTLSFCLFIKTIRSRNFDQVSQKPFDDGKNNFEWINALDIMSYHRSKMNEYLCKSYLASEIIDSFKNQSGQYIEKRAGKRVKTSRLVRDSLMKDPGSQKYKNWLSKSSTLEDIYRQFEHSEGSHNSHQETENEQEGEVTGYALLSHKNIHPKPIDFGVHSHLIETTFDPHSHYHYEEEDDHEEKGMKLKELFHFALTAIAFLAFATFMIEVIMFLMEVPSVEPDYVVVPTATGGTGPASKIKSDEPEIDRKGRFLNRNLVSLETLNKMSEKVLSSIEGFAIFKQDNGKCLQRSLCRNSEYSKSLKGIGKLLLPIWSLGASWLAGRLSEHRISPGKANTLEFLKATVVGLGNTHCDDLYSECDLSLRKKNFQKTD